MKISKTVYTTHATLSLEGEFEADDATTLLGVVEDLKTNGVTRVAANLRFVKYINSTALGSLVKTLEILRAAGGDFVVVRPSPITREIIHQMGLDSLLPMFANESTALEFLLDPQPAQAAPVDHDVGAVDPSVVLFSFDDDRSKLFKGRSRNGVGKIVSVDRNAITFTWDPTRHELDRDQLAMMFSRGSSLHVKFQIKLLRRDRFGADVTIETLDTSDDSVTVSARWSAIRGADQDALTQFAADMKFLEERVAGLPAD